MGGFRLPLNRRYSRLTPHKFALGKKFRLPNQLLVDTNVPILANGTDKLDWSLLAGKCIDLILEIVKKGGLVLDDQNRIFDEYRDYLHFAGCPGVGDLFMKWVHDNQWNSAVCTRVSITCQDESNQVFAEFPDHPELKNFDVDDRKFVAVAHASPCKAPIIQAVDFKWWGWRLALEEAGIEVVFVDEDLAKKGYQAHLGG